MSARVKVTLDEFSRFTQLPENAEKRFELLESEIIEVPSNPFVSVIAARIITLLGMYLMQNDLGGYITGEGGGYIIDGHVFAPDVAYVRDMPMNKGYETTPPMLAVEVLSDPHSNIEQTDLRRKLVHYLRARVVVWIVDYVARQVEIHRPDRNVQVLGENDRLMDEDIFPSLILPVRDVFPKQAD